MFNNYNPDVLSCLANLSNDEVFTPTNLANDMLDLLPKDLWKNPNAKFLDPCCKTGIFLREIVKRLDEGLEKIIPNKQERINHILINQIYGISITELTSLLSRRSIYCSKQANGKYSICDSFNSYEGNIRFNPTKHTWSFGNCIFCGATQQKYDRGNDLESHAYEFIHTMKPEEIFNMKFDVIIGNPPYQLNVGNTSGNSAKAKAIYHDFISQAIKMKPRYLCMITPSRWMTRSTEGISDEWVDKMLSDDRIRVIHDYLDAGLCFPGVDIKGGVNYFLWDRDNPGKCDYYLHIDDSNISHNFDYLDANKTGIVIRDINAMEILKKIKDVEGDYTSDDNKNFSGLVSPKDFFTNKQNLTSSWKGYTINESLNNHIKYYLNKNIHKLPYGYVSESDIPKNLDSIKLHKVYIPAAGGSGNDSQVLGTPFYGEPNSVCSQTYLVIGYDPNKHNLSEEECKNIITYIQTRFFRYMVSVKKKTQNGPRGVYQFVPLQNFNEPWTDEKLYQKYKLTEKEIEMIESNIKPLQGGECE